MWVYRAPPPRAPALAPLVIVEAPSFPRGRSEPSATLAASGVQLGQATAGVAAVVQEEAVRIASANVQVSIGATANGRNAQDPGATVGVTSTVQARGVKIGSATASVAITAQVDSIDVYIEQQRSDVTVTATAGQRKLGTSQSNVAIGASASGVAITEDKEGTGAAVPQIQAQAGAVVVATANATVNASLDAVPFVSPATATGEVGAGATAVATVLGPRTAQCSARVEIGCRAVGLAITQDAKPDTPVGRTIDWKSLVQGQSAIVPDYEFGHRPSQRRFYQRRG